MIDRTLEAMRPVGAPATWVLSNHDVTRHATRFANPPGLGTLIRAGRRPRTGPGRRARAATLLMLALPGSAYVYQGEELGLPDVVDLPDEVRQDPAYFRGAGQDGFRDGCRVPIPSDPYGAPRTAPATAGVLRAAAARRLGGAERRQAQTGVPGSTLELYRTALAVRRAEPDLGAGDAVEWLRAPEGVLAFRRGEFVCVANTTGESVSMPGYGRVLLASGEVTEAGGEAKVPADTTAWRTARP
ncbi:Alpha-glucosidase OS=Streptomyces fumanus OX=67302 GN=GCM10018772_00610 PE=4 SV=1 [Streptomyces fumanus]